MEVDNRIEEIEKEMFSSGDLRKLQKALRFILMKIKKIEERFGEF